MSDVRRPTPAISAILSRLRERYGKPQRHPSGDPLSGLVSTILSQSTTDQNTERAFQSLRTAFPSWDRLAAADVDEVTDAIRVGGLARQKAPRIQQALRDVHDRGGFYDLSFLNEINNDEATSWLISLHGVGPKTAACVLMFDLGRDVLPVDTHVHRVSCRLGLIDDGVSATAAQAILEEQVAEQDRYDAHVLMIQLGRDVCRARRPRCHECVLQTICPTAPQLLAEG